MGDETCRGGDVHVMAHMIKECVTNKQKGGLSKKVQLYSENKWLFKAGFDCRLLLEGFMCTVCTVFQTSLCYLHVIRHKTELFS